jgi:exodeoxyribonuclease VII large subunit
VDPRRVVERGYAIVRSAGGKVLTDAAGAPAGARLRAELRKGSIRMTSEGPEES